MSILDKGCGCRIYTEREFPKDRLCAYHDGCEDGRDLERSRCARIAREHAAKDREVPVNHVLWCGDSIAAEIERGA